MSGEALEEYGTDLTELAKQGKLRPVIKRDDEIRRCIQILCMITKSNPIIVGEPGVGKTAIVEGLAQRIVQGDVPEPLLNRKLISLDLGSLLAGAYTKDIAQRLKDIQEDVTASKGNTILFIDNIHSLVHQDGDLFKMMLGRGEMRCIGATTLAGYRKQFKKDPALERRFLKVLCHEPSVDDTISMLRGLRQRYELHHGVKISDGSLVSAAVLANRYITERFLPDKAIDLVDEAAAKLKIEISSKPTELDEVERNVITLEMEKNCLKKDTDKASKERLQKIENDLTKLKDKQKKFSDLLEEEKSLSTRIMSFKEEIDGLNKEILSDVCETDQDRVLNETRMSLRQQLLTCLQRQLEEAEKNFKIFRQSGRPLLGQEVTDHHIEDVVSKWNVKFSETRERKIGNVGRSASQESGLSRLDCRIISSSELISTFCFMVDIFITLLLCLFLMWPSFWCSVL